MRRLRTTRHKTFIISHKIADISKFKIKGDELFLYINGTKKNIKIGKEQCRIENIRPSENEIFIKISYKVPIKNVLFLFDKTTESSLCYRHSPSKSKHLFSPKNKNHFRQFSEIQPIHRETAEQLVDKFKNFDDFSKHCNQNGIGNIFCCSMCDEILNHDDLCCCIKCIYTKLKKIEQKLNKTSPKGIDDFRKKENKRKF